MASTYTYADAVTLVSSIYSRVNQDAFGSMLCDIAQSLIWNAADWRVSVAELPPFWLTPLDQDYGSPNVVIPTDFQGFRKAYCAQPVTEPWYTWPLGVRKNLETDFVEGTPQFISWEGELGKYRIWPRASRLIGAAEYLVIGTYKKSPTKITPATLQSAVIPWDDCYFEVVTKAIRYAYLDAMGDPKAGSIQWDKRMRSYVATGQLAVLKAAIEDMAEAEAINLGDDQVSPEGPLVPYWNI